MFPGTTTKLSETTRAAAATIQADADILRLVGNTALVTLVPHFGGGFSGAVIIVPTSATIATTTAGNISIVVTMPQDRATLLVYSKADNLWYPGAIS